VDPVIVPAIDDRFELLRLGLSFLMFDIAPLQSVFEVANVKCVVGLARLPEEPRRGIKSLQTGVEQVLGEFPRAAAMIPIIARMSPPVVGSCCLTEKATTLIGASRKIN
jgi:hypothetical protein